MTGGADPRNRILEMLAEGRITVDEAKSLLALVNPGPEQSPGGDETREPRARGERGESGKPRGRDRARRRGRARDAAGYFRLRVEPRVERGADPNADRVNIRVPFALVKAGARLTSLIPEGAAEIVNETLSERGLDLDFKNLDADRLEEILSGGDFLIDVAEGDFRIRISVE